MIVTPHYRTLGKRLGDDAPTPYQIDLTRTVAASAIIEILRKIVSDYELPDAVAMRAREAINDTERAFGFLSIAERPARVGDHDPEYQRTVDAVAKEIGA